MPAVTSTAAKAHHIMLFTFLIVVQAIIAAALVGVILMQRSEGGGLGVGGSPSGLMSARGTADFLTRSTSVLATLFIALSILLAALATQKGKVTVDPNAAAAAPVSTGPAAPLSTAPAGNTPLLSGAAQNITAPSAPATEAAAGNQAVPLAQ